MGTIETTISDVINRALDERLPAIRAAVREELLSVGRGDPDQLLRVSEAAALLGVSSAALRKRIARGQLAGAVRRVGASIKLRRGDILAAGDR